DVIIAAAGPGGFPLVRVFRASDGASLSQFEAFDHGFSGGVWVAAGDLDGDGNWEVVTGADAQADGDPIVTVRDAFGGIRSGNVYAFERGFHGGVRVGTADLDGDGRREILAAAGPGG